MSRRVLSAVLAWVVLASTILLTAQPAQATPDDWTDSNLYRNRGWCDVASSAEVQAHSRFEACRMQFVANHTSFHQIQVRVLTKVKSEPSTGTVSVTAYVDLVEFSGLNPVPVKIAAGKPSCAPAACTVSTDFTNQTPQELIWPYSGMAEFTFKATHVVAPGSITRPVISLPISIGQLSEWGMDWYAKDMVISSPKLRCDQALPGNNNTTGCVVEQYQPTWLMAGSAGTYPQVAAHIRDAQKYIGAGTTTPLHRTTDSQRDTNRTSACSKVKTIAQAYNATLAANHPDMYSCDEYPFASTSEGGQSTAIGTPSKAYQPLVPPLGPTSRLSIALVNNRENSAHGSALGSFYVANRILAPPSGSGTTAGDGFYARFGAGTVPEYGQPVPEPYNLNCVPAWGGASAAAVRAINAACSKAGNTPYTWGGGHGASPGLTYGFYDGVDPDSKNDGSILGFDCSGFVRWAWWRATGQDFLNSTSQGQLNKLAANPSQATKVTGKFDLLPGDVLFFGSAGKIHHVALYLGDYKVVEARESGTKIMVSSLSSHGDFYAGYRPLVAGAPVADNTGNAYVWGSAVNVRAAATTASAKVGVITSPSLIQVECQTAGERVTYANGVSDYWSKVPALGGYVSNVFIRGPEFLTGIPLCAGSSGPAPPDPGKFKVWASNINVRADATTTATKVGTIAAPTYVDVICQRAGATVTDQGNTSSWWAKINSPAGYISNVYLVGAAKLDGVPECAGSSPTPGSGLFTVWATNVIVRSIAASTGTKMGEVDSPATIAVACQVVGETITEGSYSSKYWSKITIPSGYMSNVYIKGDAQLAGVPIC